MNIKITIGYITMLVALVVATLVTSDDLPFNLLMAWLVLGMVLWAWVSLKDDVFSDKEY